MIKYVAMFKDDVAGTFDFFGMFNNPELAKRDFKYASSKSPHAEDLSLYISATYDTSTGCFNNIDDDTLGKFPYYLMRGIKE